MRLLFIALLVVLTAACSVPPTPMPQAIPLSESPRSVIVDTDMGADDMLALVYLLARPDVNVKAIALSGTGTTRCDAGIRNTQAILEVMERTTIPIACGRETPLAGTRAFPTAWRDGAETFFGIPLRPTTNVSPNETAVELLTRALEASGDKVTLLGLGPLTNVAQTLEQNRALADKIERMVIMGGTMNAPGEVEGESGVEWNFYVDPTAAHIVFESEVPITLVPLDATNQVPVTRDVLARFTLANPTPALKLAARILESLRGEIEGGAFYFWDPLTAVLVTDATVGTKQQMALTVDGESGRTREDEDGTRVNVVMQADAKRFEAIFLQTLEGRFR